MKRSMFSLIALLVVIGMVLTACGGAEAPEPTEAPAAAEPTKAPEAAEPTMAPEAGEMAEADFPMIPGGFLEKAVAGEYAGTEVTVDGPFVDFDEAQFEESMVPFEEATGITVNYIGDKEFEARLSIAVDAGDPPDIVDFPQPGGAAN